LLQRQVDETAEFFGGIGRGERAAPSDTIVEAVRVRHEPPVPIVGLLRGKLASGRTPGQPGLLELSLAYLPSQLRDMFPLLLPETRERGFGQGQLL
jgi:hypothetical protein